MIPNYYYTNLSHPRLIKEDLLKYQSELDNLPLDGKDCEYREKVQVVISRYFHNLHWRSHLDNNGRHQGVCSLSHRYLESKAFHYRLALPLIDRSISVAINTSDVSILQIVHGYCKHLFKQLGPYQLSGLGFVKETIVRTEQGLLRFFDYRVDAQQFTLPYIPGGLVLEQIEVQYNSKLGRLDVVCEMSNSLVTLKDVSLDEVMKCNPRFDFGRIALELPNTIGGQYIRNYIFNRAPETY